MLFTALTTENAMTETLKFRKCYEKQRQIKWLRSVEQDSY